MSEGGVFRKFRCPGCKGIFQFDAHNAGEVAECATCGTKLRLPGKPPPVPPPLPQLTHMAPPASTPPPLPSRAGNRASRTLRPRSRPPRPPRAPRAGARADRRRIGRSWGDDPDRWARTYALIWGIVLLAGVVVPAFQMQIGRSAHGGRLTTTRMLWFWDSPGDAGAVLGLLATIGLGILAIVGSRKMATWTLGVSLLWASAGIFLLYFVLVGSAAGTSALGVRGDTAGAVIAMLLMLFATPLIAAGNHMRKAAKKSSPPRVLAGVGGIMLVLGFLLPVWGSHAFIELLFSDGVWEDATVFGLCLSAFLTYGILGVVSFSPAPMDGLATAMSILARLIMGFVPLVTAIILADQLRGDFVLVAANFLKVFAVIYGMLALLAVGLAAWLSPGLQAAEEAAASRRRPREKGRGVRRRG